LPHFEGEDIPRTVELCGPYQLDRNTISNLNWTKKTALETAYVEKFDVGAAVSEAKITTVLCDGNQQNSTMKITFTARISITATGNGVSLSSIVSLTVTN
jgi:hypothetical protein